jgi:hypothetical protein
MSPDEDAWTIVAAGDQGHEEWESVFVSIRDVQEIISRLDEVERPISIDEVVADFNYFRRLKEMDFPPLYDLSDFEHLSGDFLYLIDEPEHDNGPPGMSFNQVQLYVDSQRIQVVLVEFNRFLQHLRSLPGLMELLE